MKRLGLLLLAACAPGGVTHVGAPDVVLSPSPVQFELAWVGFTESITVSVTNRSPVKGDLPVTLVGPFSADTELLSLGGSAMGSVVVTYRPQAAGHHVGSLQVGNTKVVLLGDARQPPDCQSSACVESTFDMLSRSCMSQWKPDGTACTTACNSGTCQSGACTGSFATCTDGNACTVDTCNETVGCGHVAKVCPSPAKLCRVAACDPSTGCGEEAAPDGTACGANLCTAIDEEVCISGVCVTRPRPGGTRCSDTWQAAYFDPRFFVGATYDDALNTMLFHGLFLSQYDFPLVPAETWTWDEFSWRGALPLSAARPNTLGGQLTYDRNRAVAVFTGSGQNGLETWEYDANGWQQKLPAHVPPDRIEHFVFYDTVRQTVCLTGGVGAAPNAGPGMPSMDWLDDLWEWDGNDWVDRTPASWPPHRWYPSEAYDEIRGKLVLIGGRVNNTFGSELFDTWEFDGSVWQQPTPAHQPDVTPGTGSTSFDVNRGKVVMVLPASYGTAGQVWEWDGLDWTNHTFFDGPGFTEAAGLQVFDPLAGQVTLFRFDDASTTFSADWHWNGDAWSSSNLLPLERVYTAIAYDPVRQRTVIFGGSHDGKMLDDTWAFDGTSWKQLMVTGPHARENSTLVYDEARAQLVLFGGDDGGHLLGDTWLFDGAQWQEATPQHQPPERLGHSMAYDRARQKVVLFGGAGTGQLGSYAGLADTWEWDGTDWTPLSPMTSPQPRTDARMVYDAKRAQMVLFGGSLHPEYGLPPQQGWCTNDTWVFDSGEWVDVTAGATLMAERALQAMAYDPVREVVMMTGGYSCAGSETRNDTWEWNGTQWTQRSPATPGPHLFGAQMVYDSARVDLVMFGGNNGNGPQWGTNVVWLYIPPP